MDLVQANADRKPLPDFCKEVISLHTGKWPPSEDTLAREFVERYSVEHFFSLERITQFSETLGIETITAPLPDRVLGFNCSFDNKKVILLPDKETFPGGREHTFLHELREILEYIFRDLGFPTVEDSALEEHAEDFAAKVRIAGSLKLMYSFLEGARNIQATWKRWLAYAGITGFGLLYGLICLLLPYAEERVSSRS